MPLFSRKPSRVTTHHGLKPADIGSRTMRGSVFAVVAQGMRTALQLLTSIVLARLLTPEDFGLVAMGAVIVAFSNLFAEFGLGAATVQRKDLDDDTVSALFYIQVGIAFVLTAAVTASSPLIAMLFGDPRVMPLIIVMSLSLPVLAAASQHIALMQRDMLWLKMQGVPIIAQASASVIAILLCLTTDIGYWALVAQSWATAVMTCAMAWIWSTWRPGRVSDWSKARPAVMFGMSLTGYNVLNGWHRQFDNILIGALYGPQQLGYYSRAYGLFMLPLTSVVRPFNVAVYPAMSRLQDEPARWRRLFLSSLATVTCLTAPFAGLLVLMADVIIPLLFGIQWLPSIDIFKMLAISMMIQPVYTAAGLLSFTLGKSRRMLYASLPSTATYTVAFIVGANWGPIGVATGYTVAVSLITPLWVWWSARGTSLSALRVFGSVAPPIAAATVALVAVGFFPLHEHGVGPAILEGSIYSALYFGILFLCWFLFKDWRSDVEPAIARLGSEVRGMASRLGWALR